MLNKPIEPIHRLRRWPTVHVDDRRMLPVPRQVRDKTALEGIALASIGPVTSATLRDLKLAVDVEAREYTIPGLVLAIVGSLRPL